MRLKESMISTVVKIVHEEAEYAHSQVLEAGYVDDISRIRKQLRMANEEEYNA